jgi:hypothetical protein
VNGLKTNPKPPPATHPAGFTPGESGFVNCSSDSLPFKKPGTIGVKPMGPVRDA